MHFLSLLPLLLEELVLLVQYPVLPEQHGLLGVQVGVNVGVVAADVEGGVGLSLAVLLMARPICGKKNRRQLWKGPNMTGN